MEPTLEVLRDCAAEAKTAPTPSSPDAAERLAAMLEFLELADGWGERAAKLSPQNPRRLSTLGISIFRLME